MYQNKKIIPIIVENITRTRNRQSNFLQSSDFTLLKNTYSLPLGIKTPEAFNEYCTSNAIRIPKMNGYNYRVPFDNVALTYEMLITREGTRNFFCLFNQHSQHFNTSHRTYNMPVNDKISIHAGLKYLEYDWETHAQLLASTKFIPILISPDSQGHDSLYTRLLWLGENEYRNALTAVPNMKLYSKEEVVFVLWKKYEHKFLCGENEDYIYSNYSKDIFDGLKTSILNYSAEQENFTEKTIPFSMHRLDISRNRSYWRSSANLHNYLGEKINLNPALDISFFKNTDNVELFTNLVNEHSLSRLQVIKAPSWKTKSHDKDISFASYTKNQCLKRHASFMGFVNFQTLLYDQNNSKLMKTFNLVSSSDPTDLCTSSRALKKLYEVLDHLLWKDGIKITDPQKVKDIFEEMYSGLNVYSDECCNKLSKEAIENLLQTNNALFSTFDSASNRTLTVQPKIDFNLKNKYTKINLLYNENLENIASTNFVQNVRMTDSTYQNLLSYRRRIRDAQEEFKQEIDNLSNSIKQIYNAANFINSNKALHQAIKTKYLNSFNSSLEKSDYTTDDFFSNLANDNIHIEEIEYTNKDKTKILNSTSGSEDFLLFASSRFLNSSDLTIDSVKFIINRPVKIKVDAKEKYVLGGPYKVICTQGSIRISLLAKESLFGIKDNLYCIHPHTTTHSSISSLFSYSSGCLGEATSLIFNAFKKCDLKLIILSAMTWVTSANSSDPWGKKYDWFPSSKSLKLQGLPQVEEVSEDLTEDEVDSFLSDICSEEANEEDQEEQILLQELENLTPIETEDLPIPTPSPNVTQPNPRWNPNEFSAPQENYVPAFNNVNNVNS